MFTKLGKTKQNNKIQRKKQRKNSGDLLFTKFVWLTYKP